MFLSSARSTAMVMLILTAAFVLNSTFAILGIPSAVSQWVTAMKLTPATTIAMLVVHVRPAGGTALLVQGDVARPAEAERMVAETVARLDGLDVLVNNAGILVRNASVTAVAIEDWQRVIDVDLTGAFLVARFAVQEMVRAGRDGAVVNVSSVSGILGDPKMAPYNAAKGGLNHAQSSPGLRRLIGMGVAIRPGQTALTRIPALA